MTPSALGPFGGMKNVIPTPDLMVTSVIDFIMFVKEIGGSGNARHLFDAWLIYSNLQYSGAVYRPDFINHDKLFPKNRENGVWHDRKKLMNNLVHVLENYAHLDDEVAQALVAADESMMKTSNVRMGKGRFGFETE